MQDSASREIPVTEERTTPVSRWPLPSLRVLHFSASPVRWLNRPSISIGSRSPIRELLFPFHLSSFSLVLLRCVLSCVFRELEAAVLFQFHRQPAYPTRRSVLKLMSLVRWSHCRHSLFDARARGCGCMICRQRLGVEQVIVQLPISILAVPSAVFIRRAAFQAWALPFPLPFAVSPWKSPLPGSPSPSFSPPSLWSPCSDEAPSS